MAYIVQVKFSEGNRFPDHIESIDLTVGTRGNEKFRVVRDYNAHTGTYDTIFDVVELLQDGEDFDVNELGDENLTRRSHPTSVHETLGITKSYINAAKHIEINGTIYSDSGEAISVLDNMDSESDSNPAEIRGASGDDLAACCLI